MCKGKKEREREIKKETPTYREHVDHYRRGGGEGCEKSVMGIKEYTSRDEH